LPKPIGGRGVGHRRSASREIDMHALKLLTRSDDREYPLLLGTPCYADLSANMTLLPITVLAFADWRRISTPGSCNPDLGGSIHLVPPPMVSMAQPFSPHLHLYAVQSGTTFRMTVHIDQDSIGPEPVHMSTNPNSDMDTVAVRLTIRPGKMIFAMWTGQAWTPALDFTEGKATEGGQCELTGKKEVSRLHESTSEVVAVLRYLRSCCLRSFGYQRSFHLMAHNQSSSPSPPCPAAGSSRLRPDYPGQNRLSTCLPSSKDRSSTRHTLMNLSHSLLAPHLCPAPRIARPKRLTAT
jgi:hypothetical protein